jgi:hypothetical protein
MRSVLREWRELSFEKKLGLVVVPLLGTVIGVTVPILASGHGSSKPSEATAPTENLQVVDLAVSGGEPHGPIGPPLKPPTIDLTVRNVGQVVSIVKRIGFRVRATGFVKICQAGGGLEPSKNYNILLPPHARSGELLMYKVSQQIAPNAADRFTIRFDIPEPDRQLGYYMYQLDVLLFHDQAKRPVPAGTVVISAPFLPTGDVFWSGVPANQRASYEIPGSAEVKACLVANEATYKRMLSIDGERSPLMTRARLKPVE